ncbi:MAG TPA: class I adenylate-forming enzyme family protein [Gaiellaceae bacterium]|nr:class I adenylate-forming enzyme family protein [Gaiellaceae bacterium]
MTSATTRAASGAGRRVVALPDVLRRRARAQPGATALTAGEAGLTYGELDRAVTDAARRLAGVGVKPGARVVLAGPNSVEWVVAFLAGLRLGAVVVPLNTRLSPAEVRRQLELCEPGVVLAAEETASLVERACAPDVLRLDGLAALPARPLDEPRLPPTAPALISFTSGSTGPPKGAVISHGALVRSASSFVPALETSSADSTLVLVPLFHNTGFADQLTQMLLVGGAVDLLPEFRTEAAIEALARRPASYLIAVPSILRLLMLHDRATEAFRACRVAVYGGAPMPAGWIYELGQRWPALGLFNCYGLTEFTSVSHLLAPEFALTRSESVGRPVEGVRHRISPDGEVWLSGPMRMTGYWRAEAQTRDVFHGPWLRTGDLGTIKDGFLNLIGRSAEVINRGGEKIYSARIEAALAELPDVADAAVVGAPHPILLERVVAWIVPRDRGGFDEGAARAHLLERVPDYAVPEAFFVADELPRGGAGKLDRAQLRAEAAAAFGGKAT